MNGQQVYEKVLNIANPFGKCKSKPLINGEMQVKTSLLLESLSSKMEKAMAPHSSTLAWKIPWMEEPGGLQSIGSLRVGHD